MRITAISTLVLAMILAGPVQAQTTGAIPAAAAPNCAQAVRCPRRRPHGRNRHHRRPGFGFEHFKVHDFLQPGEVVLTFDDGPGR